MSSRSVRVPQGVALYIGSVLGGGILVLPSLAAGMAGPASLLAWMAVTLFSLPVGLLFGALSAQYPTNGGISDFGRSAYGTHFGNLAGWLYLWILPFGQPAVMLSGMYYQAYLLGLPKWMTIALAFSVISCAALIALFGRRLTARMQMAMVSGIALILGYTFFTGITHLEPQHFVPFMPQGVLSVGMALSLVMWSYIGVENLSFIAEDFENPRRDMIRTVLIGTALVSALYLASAVLIIGVLPPERWSVTRAPFAEIAYLSAGGGAAMLVGCVGIFIVSASALASIWGGSNLCASLARQGALPAVLGNRSPNGVPRPAILLLWGLYAMTFAAIAVFDMEIESMARLVGASTLCTYMMAALSGLKLMRHQRWMAYTTLLLSLLALPFFGRALLLPVLVTVLYAAWHSLQSRSSHTSPASPERTSTQASDNY